MTHEKYTCPCCGNKLGLSKAMFLHNFSKIKCDECGSLLKPKLMHSALIGSIFGGISAASVFLVASFFMKSEGIVSGIFAGLGVGLFLWIICTLCVYFLLELEIVEKGNPHYFKGGIQRESYLNSHDLRLDNSFFREKEKNIQKNSQADQNFKFE